VWPVKPIGLRQWTCARTLVNLNVTLASEMMLMFEIDFIYYQSRKQILNAMIVEFDQVSPNNQRNNIFILHDDNVKQECPIIRY